MPTHYKIGTRGSLLALTQCGQIKEQLEKITSDTFELVIIKTAGDLNTSKPLWQMEGNNFFTKELDEALIQGKVDLVVHSHKDLGSLRPPEIAAPIVTKRSFAHDVLLIKNETISKLSAKSEMVIGTSSPRRVANIQTHLPFFIPRKKDTLIKIKTQMLRGNVNTRIQKLRDGDYDAIVIALPGIERLAHTISSCSELKRLLDGINFMVLPQSLFPSSASQGALAIEIKKERQDGGELEKKLLFLEDRDTKEEVERERRAFNEFGGGCHLAVGINVQKIKKKNKTFFLHTHEGILNEKNISFTNLEGRNLPFFSKKPRVFNGHPANDKLIKKRILPFQIPHGADLYVTSKYCYNGIEHSSFNSLWAAGVKSMKDLAGLGFWVNGTADAMGDGEIQKIRSSKALSLMLNTSSPLIVLTSDRSESSLENAQTLTCYTREVEKNCDSNFKNLIEMTDIFYWTSFFQYQTYLAAFPEIKNKFHACGIGKTYDLFEKEGCNIIPMSRFDEFNKWIESFY